MRFAFLSLLSLGGLPLSEIDAIVIRVPERKGQHILSLLFSIKKNLKSLKVEAIFMYSFNRNLLSVHLGALRVWECSRSKSSCGPGP